MGQPVGYTDMVNLDYNGGTAPSWLPSSPSGWSSTLNEPSAWADPTQYQSYLQGSGAVLSPDKTTWYVPTSKFQQPQITQEKDAFSGVLGTILDVGSFIFPPIAPIAAAYNVVDGAATGDWGQAVGGALGFTGVPGAVSGAISNATGLTTGVSNIITGAVIGGGTSALSGGNILEGAAMGAGGAAVSNLRTTGSFLGGSASTTPTAGATVPGTNSDQSSIGPATGTTLAAGLQPTGAVTQPVMVSNDLTGVMQPNTNIPTLGASVNQTTTPAVNSQGFAPGTDTTGAASGTGTPAPGSGTGSSLLGSVVSAGGTLLGAGLQVSAADKAAQALVDAAKTAAADNQATLDKLIAIQQPWLDAGKGALTTLTADLKPGGQFNTPFGYGPGGTADKPTWQNMPAYEFTLGQGLDAVKNQYAAAGGQLSSNAMKAGTDYAEGLASTTENQAYNQWLAQNNLTLGGLESEAGLGQTAVGQVSNATQTAGTNAANLALGTGAAKAAGSVDDANILGNALSSVANADYTQNLLKSIFGP